MRYDFKNLNFKRLETMTLHALLIMFLFCFIINFYNEKLINLRKFLKGI